MRLSKSLKEYLLIILRDAYKNPKYDKIKISQLGFIISGKSNKKLSDVYNVDSVYFEVIKHFPDKLIDISWKIEIRGLIDIDGYNCEEIINVVSWARKDSFWKKQILSIKKLRKKDKEGIMYFDKLKYLMEQENDGKKLYTYVQMCDMAKNIGSCIWNEYEKVKKDNITYYRKLN